MVPGWAGRSSEVSETHSWDFVGIVGKEDLPVHWGCQLQGKRKLGVAAGHLCHHVYKGCLKVNLKQRKAELKPGERERYEKEERERYIFHIVWAPGSIFLVVSTRMSQLGGRMSLMAFKLLFISIFTKEWRELQLRLFEATAAG